MHPRRTSERYRGDAVVIDALLVTTDTPDGMYGRSKMVSHARCQGLPASVRQNDGLVRDLRLNGGVRGPGVCSANADRGAERARDLIDRGLAVAASTIGLFKNEAIRDDTPFRTGPLGCVAVPPRA